MIKMFTYYDDDYVYLFSDSFNFIEKHGLGGFMEVVQDVISRYESDIRTDIKKEYEDRLNQLEKDNKDVVEFVKKILSK